MTMSTIMICTVNVVEEIDVFGVTVNFTGIVLNVVGVAAFAIFFLMMSMSVSLMDLGHDLMLLMLSLMV
jgi:hypothetical protein